MAESGVPPVQSEPTDVEGIEIPINLPSDVGMDYVPLATMLASGQLAEADQVCLLDLVKDEVLDIHRVLLPCCKWGI